MRGRRRPLGTQEAREVFEQLYKATYDQVLAYCRRRTLTHADAQDVLAATYLVAWRRIEEVAGVRTPLAWLYGVARRTLANQRRTTERQARLVGRLEQSDPAVSPDPSSTAERTKELEAVERALSSLSEADQELLRLASFEQLSYSEIAQVMGMTTPAVRSRLYRARRRLQYAFEDAYTAREGP
jgi:RNA polymerase sigma-70 factor (ECF subfamily)